MRKPRVSGTYYRKCASGCSNNISMMQVYCRLKTASDAVSRTFYFRTTLQNAVVLVKTNSIRQVPQHTGTSSVHRVTTVVLTQLWFRRRLRRMRYAEHVASKGENGSVCTVLVGKTEGWRLLERPRFRWEDVIKMCLKEVEGRMWYALICLRIRESGMLLWTK